MANENMVRAWGSNVRNAEYGFFKALVWALEQFQHKNNAPLAEMVALVNGKTLTGFKTLEGEKLTQFAGPLRTILGHTLADTKLTIKNGREKFVVGPNGGVNNDRLEALRMLASIKATVRSDAFKSAFPKAVKDQPTLDADAVAKKACEDARKALERISKATGVSMDVLRHALDAKPTNVEPAH